MKRSPTIEELKADIERLDIEIDAANMERGYCQLPFPPVSDVWSEQAYTSVLPDIQRYLTDYASLVLTAKDVVAIGESDKVNEWIALLRVAAEAKDIVLSATCTGLVSLLRITQTGNSRMYYTNLADMFLGIASEVPYKVYDNERYTGDYDGNFDEYYQQKRTEMEQWYNVN